MDKDISKAQRMYRIDKFAVPAHARTEFLERVRQTHELLRTQTGFLQDFVLEQSSAPGEFNFVTIVEWENEDVVEYVKPAVQALHRQNNFNPQEMLARLGIKADIANYKHVHT
jgi:heme-degrading monooxygenase HmoA